MNILCINNILHNNNNALRENKKINDLLITLKYIAKHCLKYKYKLENVLNINLDNSNNYFMQLQLSL